MGKTHKYGSGHGTVSLTKKTSLLRTTLYIDLDTTIYNTIYSVSSGSEHMYVSLDPSQKKNPLFYIELLNSEDIE